MAMPAMPAAPPVGVLWLEKRIAALTAREAQSIASRDYAGAAAASQERMPLQELASQLAELKRQEAEAAAAAAARESHLLKQSVDHKQAELLALAAHSKEHSVSLQSQLDVANANQRLAIDEATAQRIAREVEDDQLAQALELVHLLQAGEPIVANVDLHERAELAQPGQRRDLIVLEGQLGELLQPVQALDARDLVLAQVELRQL